VLDLFEQRASARPDAPALVMGDRTVSYGELDAAAGAVAARLSAAHPSPGVVGVLAPRSPGLLAGMLAVWKAGGVYLPLDPAHPADRIAFMLRDAGAVAVLADPAFTSPVEGLPLVPLDSRPGPPPVRHAPAQQDPAYIIYTSGSTGTPKGVLVGHRALLNIVLELADAMESGPAERWTTMAPATFDISMAEFCVPLASGAALVLTSEADLRDADRLVRLLDGHDVTRMQAVPSQWRALLDAGFGRTRMVAMAGGEALPPALARALRERVRTLLNGYGPTETAVVSTFWRVPPDPDEITIGTPIANTRVYIVDGELCVAGAGVAEGYVNRPELTAERFVPDPEGGPDARMYRTGDRCRARADGTLEFLGRNDGQVKVRGQRIELGEVEAGLTRHPEIAGAAATVRDGALVAYVVTGALTPSQVRDFARETLPAAMVPNAVVVLEEFPLTPNGKVDRAALPDPAAYVAPAKPEADPVFALCGEVLGIPRVRPEDDLFDLGADSLALMQLTARMRERWGIEVPVDVFYEAGTVADVADAVAALRAGV
jgi:amino acid adenylation domain-containing protein